MMESLKGGLMDTLKKYSSHKAPRAEENELRILPWLSSLQNRQVSSRYKGNFTSFFPGLIAGFPDFLP